MPAWGVSSVWLERRPVTSEVAGSSPVLPGPTHTNVIFDCLHPVECALSPSEFKRKLGDMVVEEYPEAVPKITVDEDYVSAEQ